MALSALTVLEVSHRFNTLDFFLCSKPHHIFTSGRALAKCSVHSFPKCASFHFLLKTIVKLTERKLSK